MRPHVFRQRTACAWGALVATLVAPSATCAWAVSGPVVAHVAAGYAAPRGQAGEFFDPGWALSGGATVHFDPKVPWGLRLDLGYSRFDATHQIIGSAAYPRSSRVDGGYMSVGHLTVDAVYEFGGKGRVGGYVSAGIGGYSRYRTVTRTVLVGGLSCDPLWPGFCLAYGAGDVLENSDRVTRIGYDLSLAVTFPLRSAGEIYLEGRYQRMESDPATDYVPFVVGYRW